MTFVDDVLTGRATVEDAEFYRTAWEGSGVPYHDFLGLLWPEYAMYVEDDDVLAFVIEARRKGEDLHTYAEPRREQSPAFAELWSLVERYAKEWAAVKP